MRLVNTVFTGFELLFDHLATEDIEESTQS